MHNLDKTKRLIERIVRALVEHTEAVTITHEHIPRLTQWYLKVNGEDQGKVRGRKAAHIIALQYIIQEIGARHEETQRVTLLESDERIIGHRSPLRMAEQYNPGDAHELLHDILATILAAPFRIDVRPDPTGSPGMLGYDFHITTSTAEDQEKVLAPYDDDPNKTTLIASLGTLWRAYANREGVSFKISIDSR